MAFFFLPHIKKIFNRLQQPVGNFVTSAICLGLYLVTELLNIFFFSQGNSLKDLITISALKKQDFISFIHVEFINLLYCIWLTILM